MTAGTIIRRLATVLAVCTLSVLSVAPAPAAGSIVTTLSAKQSGTGSVTLTWTHSPAAPTAQHLVVYRTAKVNVKLRTILLAPSVTATVVKDLAAGRYQFQIVTTEPNGKANAYVTVTSAPAQVKGLKAAWIGKDLLVTWTPVNDSSVLVGILVTGPANYRREFAVTGSSAGVKVTGADPASTYKVTAVSSNPAGVSKPVQVVAGPAASTDLQLNATAMSPTSVRLSWASTTATNWRVSIASVEGSRNGETITTSTNSLTIDRLTPAATYRFTLRGNSDTAGASVVTTTVKLPAAVVAPVALVVVPGDGTVKISWSAGAGSTSTSYRVSWRAGTTGDWTDAKVTTEQAIVINGLTNGKLHMFRVEALDADGNSAAASPVSAIPARPTPTTTPPPTNQSPANNTETDGDGNATPPATPSVTLRLDAGDSVILVRPSSDIAQVQWKADDATSWNTATVTTSTYRISGLTNGISYNVRPLDGTGNVIGSAVTATPTGVPTQVGNVSINPGHSQLELKWAKPINDGGVIMLGYRVSWRGDSGYGESFVGPDMDSVYITGLRNGSSYSVTIVAVNRLGDSDPVTRSATPAA